MSKETMRLASAIRVSRAAALRLRDSVENDIDALRAGIAAGDRADRDQLRALDAFIQRYQQLFEHLAQRLFPAVYRATEFGDRPLPLRSLLIWGEEVGLIHDALVWVERAELRNRLVHEYPVQPEQRAIALSSAIHEAGLMLQEFDKALAYVAASNFLESGQA